MSAVIVADCESKESMFAIIIIVVHRSQPTITPSVLQLTELWVKGTANVRIICGTVN